MRIRKSKLKDFEGEKITFQYDGPDHPNGKIGTQRVTGQIIKVDIDSFKIDIHRYPDTKLTINNIKQGSIKRRYN